MKYETWGVDSFEIIMVMMCIFARDREAGKPPTW